MKGKVNNIVRIPTSLSGKFFRYWLEFLTPFHHLTNKEMDVMTCFLKHRQVLKEKISDPEILDKVLMGEDTKRMIREECNMKVSNFQVVLGKLRRRKVIIGNSINPKFIPNVTADAEGFQLLLLFEFDDK
jgi:hypothetical protein